MMQQHGIICCSRNCYSYSPPQKVYIKEEILTDNSLPQPAHLPDKSPSLQFLVNGRPIVSISVPLAVERHDQRTVDRRGETDAGDLILHRLDVDGEVGRRIDKLPLELPEVLEG